MNYDCYVIKIKLEYLDRDYYIGDWNGCTYRNEDDNAFPYILNMPITENIHCAARIGKKEDAEKIAQSIKNIWGFSIMELVKLTIKLK